MQIKIKILLFSLLSVFAVQAQGIRIDQIRRLPDTLAYLNGRIDDIVFSVFLQPLDSLEVTNDGIIGGDFIVTGTLTTGTLVTTNFSVTGDMTVGDDLTVVDDATIGDNINIGGSIIPLISVTEQLGSSPLRWDAVWATYYLMGNFPHAGQIFADTLTATRHYTFPNASGFVTLFDSSGNLSLDSGSVQIAAGEVFDFSAYTSLILGATNDISANGGVFNAADRAWLNNNHYAVYSLGGIRTDGDVVIDVGNLIVSGTMVSDSTVYFYGGFGDIDGNGQIQNTDLVYILGYLDEDSTLTVAQYQQADIDGDGKVSRSDYEIVKLMNGVSLASPTIIALKDSLVRQINGDEGLLAYNDFNVMGALSVDGASTLGNDTTFISIDPFWSSHDIEIVTLATGIAQGTIRMDAHYVTISDPNSTISYSGLGQFDATDINWMVERARNSLYVLNGIRTDGDIVIDRGNFFAPDTSTIGHLNIDSSLTVGAFTIPTTDGTPNQILKTDGAGVITWQADAQGAGGAAFADSVVHDGRNVTGDSLITDEEGIARFEPLGITESDISDLQFYLLPPDTTEFRTFSDSKYVFGSDTLHYVTESKVIYGADADIDADNTNKKILLLSDSVRISGNLEVDGSALIGDVNSNLDINNSTSIVVIMAGGDTSYTTGGAGTALAEQGEVFLTNVIDITSIGDFDGDGNGTLLVIDDTNSLITVTTDSLIITGNIDIVGSVGQLGGSNIMVAGQDVILLDGAAYSVYYTNSLGNTTELPLGADETFLMSNGPAANPTFEAVVTDTTHKVAYLDVIGLSDTMSDKTISPTTVGGIVYSKTGSAWIENTDTPTDEYVLTWEASDSTLKWQVDATGGSPALLSDIGDVTAYSSIGAGELQEWSGSAWVHQTLTELAIVSVGDNVTDLDGTAYRVFYTNTTGDIVELPFGADGTFLQSSGASTLPEFTALVAGDIPDISATYLVLADTTEFRTFSDLKYSGGSQDFLDVLTLDPDGGDIDQTSLGKLEFFDAGLFLDADADGVMNLSSDGTLELHSSDWDISTTGDITNASGNNSQWTNDAGYLLAGDNVTVLDGTAYRVFYTNTTGDVTELALGADGTYLKSTGASSVPIFDTPSGSGDVVKVGTPLNDQVGIWTGDGTIEGDVDLTFDGDNLSVDGVVTGTGFTIGSAAILEAELEIIDGATLTTTQLNYINGATGTTGTTTTNIVFSTSPTLITPALGTPTALVLTSATGLPLTTGVTGVLPDANVANDITITNISQVGDISATASEINTPLDGATVTLVEFQQLQTIAATTISAAQWTVLGGIAGTLTFTELDYVDGVTSAIQTQFTGKEGTLTNEAGLYAALGDVTDFVQGGEVNSIDSDMYVDGSIDAAHLAIDIIDETHLEMTNSPTDNFILSYNTAGTNFTWVVDATGGNPAKLDDIGDVDTYASIGADELIQWDGDSWLHSTITEAGMYDTTGTQTVISDSIGIYTIDQTEQTGFILGSAGTFDEYSRVAFVDSLDLVMTLLDGTAYRVFYTNTTGDVTELPFGADGTFLQSSGASTLPEFTALVAADIPDVSATYLVLADTTEFRTFSDLKYGGAQDFLDVLTADPDGGDVDQTSLGKLEFFDAGLFLDADADGVMNLSSDGTLELHSNDWDISATGDITNASGNNSQWTNDAGYLLAGDNATVLDGTNWRVLYVNGTGDVTELAFGADGTFLQSSGASTLPEFTALVAGDIPDVSATYLILADTTEFRTFSDLKYEVQLDNEAGLYAVLSDVTQFVEIDDNLTLLNGTNWRVFYTDGSSNVTELALGADGTFLQSGGAAVLPEFTALVAGDIPDVSATYLVLADTTEFRTFSDLKYGDMNDLIDDLTPQLGGNLDINGKALFLAGESWEASVAANELCYFSGTNWDETDADAEATSNKMLGIAIGTTDILTFGVWTTTGLTSGAIYYVSTTEAGITTTAPSATADIVRVVGYALSTTELYFDPSKTWIEIP